MGILLQHFLPLVQQAMMQAQVQGIPPQQAMMMIPQPQQPQLPPQESIMAQASIQIVQEDSSLAQQAMEAITAADQFVKDNMAQKDPNMAAVIEQAKNQRLEIERKADKDKADSELAERREDNLRELEAIQKMEEKRQADFDQRMTQLELLHGQKMDTLTQQVELMKNDQDNRQAQLTELLKNHDDNKTAVIVEQVRQAMNVQQPEQLSDDRTYIAEIQGLIRNVQEAQTENKLGIIMEGLQTAIASARAPRRNTPVRDEEGNLVASISSIDE